MSNFPPYSLDDDDHIDDQETNNVRNLIIDLERDLEKERIKNELQAHAKPTNCTNTTGAPTSSTSSLASANSFAAKASSSTSATSGSGNGGGGGTTTNLNPLTLSGKSNQKSSGKHSNISTSNNANVINNNNNNNNIISSNANNNNNSISTINSSMNAANTSNNNNNNNNGHLMTTRTVFNSIESRGELKMIITRETKPGKSEHKIVTSPNQKSPTSSSSSTSVNEIASNSNNYEDSKLHDDPVSKQLQSSSSISSTKECGTSTSIGTITEPDCLGPCEPGTSVTLEGIVWQETDGGILVVNVTWRGKTYVGALLDCTRHDWAPPRLCDSPASDIDSKAHKGVRTKRIVTRSNGIGLDEKNLLQTTGKLRNGKGRRILNSTDLTPCNKRQRDPEKSSIENLNAQSEANTLLTNVSTITNSETACVPMNIDTIPATNNESISTSNVLTDKAGPNSPIMIGCSEPNCSKKFRNNNGLMYHKTHAHGTDNNESNNAQDNDCSSSVKDKVDAKSKKDQVEHKQEALQKETDIQSPRPTIELNKLNENPVFPVNPRRRTPSPQLTVKMSNKNLPDSSPVNNTVHNQELRPTAMMRVPDPERRNSSDTNHNISNKEFNRRSPGISRHLADHGHGFNNHSTVKLPPSNISMGGCSGSSSGINNSKQINPPPLPVATEEGMKPSGTSTGPPPAPHQANCYFNSAFLSNSFGPYGGGMPPYFPRQGLPPIYDPLAPPTSSTSAAFLSRFMPNLRMAPPLESSPRLLTAPMSKNPLLPPTPLPPYPGPNAYPPYPPPATHPPFPPPTK